MAFDAFVQISGIEGESTDEKHLGWIEIIRFGVGVKQTVSNTASSCGGACAERANFEDFIFRKLLDKASPKLAQACAAGTEKVPFMTYTLKNCMISRVATNSGSDVGNKFPAETIKINYGTIEWRYTLQKRQGGTAAGNVVCGWNLQRNCKM
jgi:type VI protein secretion system component Hcp